MNLTTGGVKNRKISALARLEQQLVKKTKFVNAKKLAGNTNLQVTQPLTEQNVFRINQEINTLKEKIKNLN